MGDWEDSMDKTTWKKTAHQGVRYRVHPTRKHGVQHDRYFAIRYYVNGKRIEEGLGWASEGWTAQKAADERGELRKAAREGSGPRTRAERRQEAEERRKEAQRAKRDAAAKDISFRDFAEEQYFPIAEPGWKPETARKHREHCTTWLYPHFGGKALRRIALADINKVKAAMMKAGRSARTLQATFRTFSMIWAAARDAEVVTEKPPTKKASFKLEKIDNERQRYLDADEAEHLLACIRFKNEQAADMALVSLESGLRFGEVAALTWDHIDLEKRVLRVMNTKSKRDRNVPMTVRLHSLLAGMEQDGRHVFPTQRGGRHAQVPAQLKRAITDSLINQGVTDSKMRVSFHTLRHTYASRLVQQGVDLYRVQRLLGHSTPTLTARYAKLADEDLHEAVATMERKERMKGMAGKVVPLTGNATG